MLAMMMQRSGELKKKNILNKALSLNACYQNPVINLNERKNLVS